jgi:hypothetical protein
MFRFIIILMIYSTLVSGCREIPSKKSMIEKVNILFIKGPIEPHIPFACGQLLTLEGSEISKDTIIYDQAFLRQIEEGIHLLDKRPKNDEQNNCDIRVQCELYYNNGKKRRMCIGDFNCIKLDGIYVGTLYDLEYLIKVRTGYYNYFQKWVLDYFNEIKQFGVPENYKEIKDPFFQ